MKQPKRLYYGWIIVGVALLCYGFGISPAYYSWGFFGPELREGLGLTREQTGSVFGWFQFTFSVVGLLVGMALTRWGARRIMTVGALVCALGFYLVSKADSVWDCYLAYSLIGGVGIGFSTIIPCQTLATQWFERHRARAMGIILAGGALVGMAVNPFNAAMLATSSWRSAWVIIAGISVVVAILAALFVRDAPEDLGLEVDGRSRAEDSEETRDTMVPAEGPQWTTSQALRTPQFVLITLAGVAYSIPWGVVTAHGGLYLRDELGLATTAAAGILGLRVGVSAFGRLCGSAGDFISPPRLLALALAIEGVGVAALAFAQSQLFLYAGVVLLGLGFGLAYVTVPVVFGFFFGRRVFPNTTGTRIMINSVFGLLAPRYAGTMADAAGSYVPVFWLMTAITLVGAVLAYFCVKPTAPESAYAPAPAS